jgi:hypothetical protein
MKHQTESYGEQMLEDLYMKEMRGMGSGV